ncbi:MAG: AAA family ATPase [Victivallaceae bacterium]|nr:AAA family ATPase [Victivallaceae bacterium]
MTTANTTTDRIKTLVERIAKHQQSLGLSDNAFVSRYQRHLGSVRTWADRLKAGDLSALKPDRWEGKLSAFVAELDGGTSTETVSEKMPVLVAMRELYQMLQGQRTDRRCVIMPGVTGVGKTVSARTIVNESPDEAGYLQIFPTWRDSGLQLALAFARAVGAQEAKTKAATFNNVVEVLKANPITIFIDDAHEGGVELLKMCKALIDATRVRLFLLVYPTAWRRLITANDDAHDEAQQLLGRTLKPVFDDYETGVDAETVAVFLREVGGLSAGVASASKTLAPILAKKGNLRLLADAVETARIAAEVDGTEIDVAAVVNETRNLARQHSATVQIVTE